MRMTEGLLFCVAPNDVFTVTFSGLEDGVRARPKAWCLSTLTPPPPSSDRKVFN